MKVLFITVNELPKDFFLHLREWRFYVKMMRGEKRFDLGHLFAQAGR